MSAEQIYRTLLRLYPNDYRALFALEMQNAFDRAAGEHRLLGRFVFTRFLLSEFIGLLTGITCEWIAKLTTDGSVRGRCLPDLRMMRPPGVRRSAPEPCSRLSTGRSLGSGGAGCDKNTISLTSGTTDARRTFRCSARRETH